ncbi:MAG: integration host factor subunit alpha [Thermodesulfobacteriota bacterium]|nr:integration host factor subunit alpha [Thermodesulfobacteriota bacterium]
MTVTKASLAQKICEKHDRLRRDHAVETVEAFLSIAKACLANGEDLLVSGFGKFCVKEKRSRRGRNPQTGTDLILDARKVVTFKPSGTLRKIINRNNK